MNTPFRKILIANRGEIAGRIAKAAGALGMETVAVYAPVDALSLHTRYASETRELNGSSDPVGAYLDITALIAVAEETGCDALHPGYGFLSENEELARRCAEVLRRGEHHVHRSESRGAGTLWRQGPCPCLCPGTGRADDSG